MIADRNKSEITHTITGAVYSWLDNHGFKPVETEVPVANQWVADLAGVIEPTQTELINMRLIDRRPHWKASQDVQDAWERSFLTMRRVMTCLVEVKTSRGDFLGDKKWTVEPPTDISFLAVPSGMIRKGEWPDGWGILELRGDVMAKIRNPVPRTATKDEQLDVIHAIGVRRDHFTRYERDREWRKEERIERGERTSVHRLRDIVRVVRDISAGKYKWSGQPITSVEEVCRYHGLRDVREPELKLLGEVFGIASRAPCDT